MADDPPPILDRSGHRLVLDEHFAGPELDDRVWIASYLPQWSSREASAARYDLGADGLRLLITADQQPWAPDIDVGTVVSSLQTGVYAGPLGSAIGQHHFRPGLVVTQEQRNVALLTPRYGIVECRANALTDPANMVALWMIGYEDRPERSGEICVFEIFGRDVGDAGVRIGMGIHPFGDPALIDDFEAVEVAIDARRPHTYAAQWTPDWVAFYVDDRLVKHARQSPSYPLQLMLNIYEFRTGPELPSLAEAYPKAFSVEWLRVLAPHR